MPQWYDGLTDHRQSRKMRRILTILLALGVLAGTAIHSRADAPFIPNGKAPDYVVTMVTRTIHRKEESSRAHTHHAGWTRIDEREGRQLSTRYFGHAQSVLVRVQRNGAGGLTNFSIIRNYVGFPHRDSFKTGETQTILGETCTLWNVMRTEPGTMQLAKLSCVTEDGIELAYRHVSQETTVVGAPARIISSGEATRIERRPLLPSDVRPPVEALELRSWNEPADQNAPPPKGAPGDHEVVIEGEGELANHYTRLVRTHYPWTFRDERSPVGIRTVSTRNQVSGFGMSVTIRDPDGTPTLTINKFAPPQQATASKAEPQGPKDLGRDDTVLGEACRWSDAQPGLMDAGLHECRTSDGIVLKERQFGRGKAYDLVATRLTRRPVALSEVLLPADMLAPRTWGLPE